MHHFWEESLQPNAALVADVPPAPWRSWVDERARSKPASRGLGSRKRTRFAYPDAGNGARTTESVKSRGCVDAPSAWSAPAADGSRETIFAYQEVPEDADSAWRSKEFLSESLLSGLPVAPGAQYALNETTHGHSEHINSEEGGVIEADAPSDGDSCGPLASEGGVLSSRSSTRAERIRSSGDTVNSVHLFQTGNGKRVAPSSEAMARAQRLLAGGGEKEGEEGTLARARAAVTAPAPAPAASAARTPGAATSGSLSLFQTGSGKRVAPSSEAMARAQRLLAGGGEKEEEEGTLARASAAATAPAPAPTASAARTPGAATSGSLSLFQTGSGKRMAPSSEAMARAQQLLAGSGEGADAAGGGTNSNPHSSLHPQLGPAEVSAASTSAKALFATSEDSRTPSLRKRRPRTQGGAAPRPRFQPPAPSPHAPSVGGDRSSARPTPPQTPHASPPRPGLLAARTRTMSRPRRFVSPRKRPRGADNGAPSLPGAAGAGQQRKIRGKGATAVSHLRVSASELLARKRPPSAVSAPATASPGPAGGARRARHPNMSVDCLSWEEAAQASLGPPGAEIVGVDDHRARLAWGSARARLLTDGARGPLCTEAWIRHHFRCCLWRLAHQERMEPRWRGKRLLPEVLYAQLQYRYRRELEMGQRCALSTVMARDQTAKRLMTLVVVGVPVARHPGAGTGGMDAVAQELLLADGWYAVRASLDQDLSAVVRAGRLGVGDKLHVFGASLAGAPTGCLPLECEVNNAAGATSVGGAPVLSGEEEPRLRLSYNSVRPAPLSCKLGLQAVRCPRVCVSSLRPGGGVVPCIEVVVTRATPLLFMERLAPGSVLVRTEAEEVRAQESADQAAAQDAGRAVVERLEKWGHPAAPRARKALQSRSAGKGDGMEHVLSLLEEGHLDEDQGEEIHRLVQQARRAERDVAPFVAVQAVCLSPPRELLHAMGIARGAGAVAARTAPCIIEAPRTLCLGPSPPARAAPRDARSPPTGQGVPPGRGSGTGSSPPRVDSLIARSVVARTCELTLWKTGPAEAARLTPGTMLRVYLAHASTRGAYPPMFTRQHHGEAARPLLRLSAGRNARWSQIGRVDESSEDVDGAAEGDSTGTAAAAAATAQRGGPSADRVAWVRRMRQRIARAALSRCTPPPIARLHTLRPGLAVDVPGVVLRIVGPLAPERRRGRCQAGYHIFLADESCRVLVVTAPGDSGGPFIRPGSGMQHGSAESDAPPPEPKVAALHREDSRAVFAPRLPAGVVCTAVGIAAAERDPAVGVERCQWTDFSTIVRASHEPTAAVQRKVQGLICWARSLDGVQALEAMSRQLETTLDRGPTRAAPGDGIAPPTPPPDSLLSGQLVASGHRLSVSVMAGEDSLRVAASFAGSAPASEACPPQGTSSPNPDLAGRIASLAGPPTAARALQASSPSESLGSALSFALFVRMADGSRRARIVWPSPHVEKLLRFVATPDAAAVANMLQPPSGSWDAHTLAAMAVEGLVLRAVAQRIPRSDPTIVDSPEATLPTLFTSWPVLLWRCFFQCRLLLGDTHLLDDHMRHRPPPPPAQSGTLLRSILGTAIVQGLSSHTVQAAAASAGALLELLEQVARERDIPVIAVEVPPAMGRPSYQVPVIVPMTRESQALHESILARRLDALAVTVHTVAPIVGPRDQGTAVVKDIVHMESVSDLEAMMAASGSQV